LKISKGEKAFYAVNTAFLILLTFIIMYPLIYVISASLSSSEALKMGEVVLFPKDFSLAAYKYIFGMNEIWISYLNSIYYTVVGTAVCMVVTISCAYPLSKDKLPGKRIFGFFLMVTMWFSAGTIPMYLNFRDLGLLNTRSAIILGFACETFNVILMRNFFMSVPKSLEEAAEIDGAGQWRILTKIYLPLSMPAIATITLFYAVAKWNGYFWSMILLNNDKLIPLQVLIKKMIVELKVPMEQADLVDASTQEVTEETVVYASIIVSSLPMLILYPFIQRFFVKGVMVGAVKG